MAKAMSEAVSKTMVDAAESSAVSAKCALPRCWRSAAWLPALAAVPHWPTGADGSRRMA